MKITLPPLKIDKKIFLSMSRLSHEDERIPRKPSKKKTKTQENLVTAHQVTQDPDDMEKGDKVGSNIEVSKKRTVCVTPHPSSKTPTPDNNRRDYKGDTQDKTLDSETHDSDVLKNMMLV